MNLRDRRLLEDHNRLLKLAKKLNKQRLCLEVDILSGTPPSTYLLSCHFRGYISFEGQVRSTHLVRIELPENYPFTEGPRFFFIDKPVLIHPNIWHQSGLVCLDYSTGWRSFFDLDQLVINIIKMIQLHPDTINLDQATNDVTIDDWETFLRNYPTPLAQT